MGEILTEYVTLYSVGVYNIYYRGGGGCPPVAVTNSKFPKESPIFDFDHRLPENPDSLYLNVVSIPQLPKRTITYKIDFWNYGENYKEDKDKWEVDYDRKVGPFFGAVAYEK